MKKIKIQEIRPPNYNSNYTRQRLYEVFLWNSEKLLFSNHKEVKKFLAETNRFLNDFLHELNYIYYQLFTCYRQAWLILDDNFKQQAGIESLLETINKAFDLAVNRSHWVNGNYNTGRHLFHVIEDLKEINSLLIQFYKKKFYYREIQLLEVFERQLTFLNQKLSEYSKSHNNIYVKPSK